MMASREAAQQAQLWVVVAVPLCWPCVLIPCGFASILGPWRACPVQWHYFGKWVSWAGIELASPQDECRGGLCEALGARQHAQLTSSLWGQQQGGKLQPFLSPPIGNQQDCGHADGCGAAHVPALVQQQRGMGTARVGLYPQCGSCSQSKRGCGLGDRRCPHRQPWGERHPQQHTKAPLLPLRCG